MILKIFLLITGVLSTTIAYEICGKNETGTFYRDYSTCQSYIACSDGIEYSGKCPGDYIFNSEKSSCDFPKNVKCNLVCPNSGNTAFRLPNSCSKYISCSRGKAKYNECSPGNLFDVKSKGCVQMDRTECPFTHKMCPDSRVSNTIASTEKCSLYYQCQNGKPKLKECEGGLHFNAVKSTCDTPANAKCPIVTPKSEELSDIQLDCPRDGVHFVPHPLSCHLYHICFNGHVTFMNCAPGLTYDFVSEKCRLPKFAKCIVDILKMPLDKQAKEFAALPSSNNSVSSNKPQKKPSTKTTMAMQ